LVDGHILPLKVYYSLYTPSRELSFSGKLYYDHQSSRVVYNSNSFRWKAVKTLLTEVTLKVSHSLSKDHLGKRLSEGLSYGLEARVRRIYATFDSYYDYRLHKNVRSSVDLSYRKKCWSLGIRYERDYDRDSGKYEWRAMVVFTVFSNPFNFLITGGRQ
jgi:lipopolysaccharide assembly outer membrane protein LptD (OstA)